MLAYLDALCAALLARNAEEIDRLLGLPLARTLPRDVREEALTIRRARVRSFVAPVRTMHFYYQTMHVLRACTTPPAIAGPGNGSGIGANSANGATGDEGAADAPPDTTQIELPLHAAEGAR